MLSLLLAVLSSAVVVQGAGTPVEGRTLKAAALHSDIAKRSDEVPLRQKLRLDYVEDYAMDDDHFGAQVNVHSTAHSLLLEEIDHMLEQVHCKAGFLEIKFRTEHFASAREKLDTQLDLMVITSHYGCNDAGSRMPYKIVDREYSDSGCSARFKLGQGSWNKDYKLEVNFGPEDRRKYGINRHSHLRRRQEGADGSSFLDEIDSIIPDIGTPMVSEAATLSGSQRVAFPTATATGTLNSSMTGDVSTSLKDTKIFPPDLNGIQVPGLEQLQAAGITITCKDCSTRGKVSIGSGYFSSTPQDPTSFDFIQNGFASISTLDLGASMSFHSTLTPSLSKPLNISLPSIPLTPITIPGVANLGLTFTPRIIIAATVSSTINFSYGFDASIPSNATAVVNFDSPTNSTARGFNVAKIDPLPFNALVPNVAGVKLSVTFQPEIALGATLLNQRIGAALFVNMPELAATISGVNNTNYKCEPVANSTTAMEEASKVNELFGPLVHVKPEVNLAAGFLIEGAGVFQTAWTPLATSFAVPTGCFAFDKEKMGFESAPTAWASATSSAAEASRTAQGGSARQISGASRGAAGVEDGMGLRMRALLVALGVVMGSFMLM